MRIALWIQRPLYMIGIKGHLGAIVPSAVPVLVPRRHGAHSVLTGLLDR